MKILKVQSINSSDKNDCPNCYLELKDKDKNAQVDKLVRDIVDGKIPSNFDEIMKELDRIIDGKGDTVALHD